MKKLFNVLLAVLFVCALSGLAIAGKISQDGTSKGQAVDLNFVGPTVTKDGGEATITTNEFIDDATLTFGTGDDASIYYDSSESALIIQGSTTFKVLDDCIKLRAPDNTFASCCVDNSNTFTCVAE